MTDISKAIGQGVEIKTSTTTQKGRWFGGSESKSEGRRPLLDPGDVRKLGMDEAIVLVTGTRPLRAKKIRWFALRRFCRRGVDLKRRPDTPLVQNDAILAMHEAAEVPPPGAIVTGRRMERQEDRRRAVPGGERRNARKWRPATGRCSAKHRAFVDHRAGDDRRDPGRTARGLSHTAAVERLRQGEVMSRWTRTRPFPKPGSISGCGARSHAEIAALLEEPSVTDVTCNADGHVFVYRTGRGRTDSWGSR